MNYYALIYVLILGYFEGGRGDFQKEVCSQPSDEGYECESDEPRKQYYFNKKKERCEEFEYKGCGGNSNRFPVQDDCTDSCQVDHYYQKNKKEEKKGGHVDRSHCNLPKRQGECKALIPMWYYDKQSGECQEFTWGGCKGNKNRFTTEKECKEVCMPDEQK